MNKPSRALTFAVFLAPAVADVVNEFGDRILHPPGRLHMTDLLAVSTSSTSASSINPALLRELLMLPRLVS